MFVAWQGEVDAEGRPHGVGKFMWVSGGDIESGEGKNNLAVVIFLLIHQKPSMMCTRTNCFKRHAYVHVRVYMYIYIVVSTYVCVYI